MIWNEISALCLLFLVFDRIGPYARRARNWIDRQRIHRSAR